jgi:hypothetical protein
MRVYGRRYAAPHCRESNKTPLVSSPRRRFWIAHRSFLSVSQCDSEFMVVPWVIKSTRRMPLQSQKTMAMIFRASSVCLNFFCFGDPVCLHCKDCCLLSGVIWAIQVLSPVTMWSRNSSPSLW